MTNGAKAGPEPGVAAVLEQRRDRPVLRPWTRHQACRSRPLFCGVVHPPEENRPLRSHSGAAHPGQEECARPVRPRPDPSQFVSVHRDSPQVGARHHRRRAATPPAQRPTPQTQPPDPPASDRCAADESPTARTTAAASGPTRVARRPTPSQPRSQPGEPRSTRRPWSSARSTTPQQSRPARTGQRLRIPPVSSPEDGLV